MPFFSEQICARISPSDLKVIVSNHIKLTNKLLPIRCVGTIPYCQYESLTQSYCKCDATSTQFLGQCAVLYELLFRTVWSLHDFYSTVLYDTGYCTVYSTVQFLKDVNKYFLF